VARPVIIAALSLRQHFFITRRGGSATQGVRTQPADAVNPETPAGVRVRAEPGPKVRSRARGLVYTSTGIRHS
jgi:hypothetical protein